MSECPHGLDTRWCATCLHGVERKQRAEPERTTTAIYAGRCDCGETIREGDTIGLVDGSWLGSCCIKPGS